MGGNVGGGGYPTSGPTGKGGGGTPQMQAQQQYYAQDAINQRQRNAPWMQRGPAPAMPASAPGVPYSSADLLAPTPNATPNAAASVAPPPAGVPPVGAPGVPPTSPPGMPQNGQMQDQRQQMMQMRMQHMQQLMQKMGGAGGGIGGLYQNMGMQQQPQFDPMRGQAGLNPAYQNYMPQRPSYGGFGGYGGMGGMQGIAGLRGMFGGGFAEGGLVTAPAPSHFMECRASGGDQRRQPSCHRPAGAVGPLRAALHTCGTGRGSSRTEGEPGGGSSGGEACVATGCGSADHEGRQHRRSLLQLGHQSAMDCHGRP